MKDRHSIRWFSLTVCSKTMGVSQEEHGTFLWSCKPNLDGQAFSKGVVLYVANEKSLYGSDL